MSIFLLIIIAYHIGSIPTAVWVSKYFFSIDIREYGSGNAGATNTFRTLGKGPGIAVMAVDMLKGFAAINLAFLSAYAFKSEQFINLQIALGIFAVVGHIFPIFAGFRGGKGVATLFGMILGIQPLVALILVGVFVFMLFLTRYVSLSSIAASIAFPVMILFILKEPEDFYRLFAIATACMVVLSHHKNISRLINGNENKVNLKKKKNK